MTIPLQEQEGIRELFAGAIRGRVKIDYFTQRRTSVLIPGREECLFCEDVQTILLELSRLHSLITLTLHELGSDRALEEKLGIAHVPATVIRGVLNRPVLFYGFPMATLFPPLVETIVLISQNKTELPQSVSKKLKRLRDPVTVRLFVSPDSEFCPPMMLAAFTLAIENKLLKVEVTEILEFPRIAERYGVKQVPFTVIDDRVAFPGAVDVETFADQILRARAGPTITAQLPRSGGATLLNLGGDASKENVRPSGLIIPGR